MEALSASEQSVKSEIEKAVKAAKVDWLFTTKTLVLFHINELKKILRNISCAPCFIVNCFYLFIYLFIFVLVQMLIKKFETAQNSLICTVKTH